MSTESGGPTADDLESIASRLRRAGIARISSFAWRDLDDPEAGGSEVHAHEIMRRWADHGLEVFHRTSTADHPRAFTRSGYRVVQRGSRYTVFGRVIGGRLVGARPQPAGDEAVVEIWNGVPWFSPVWHQGPGVVWLHHVHDRMWADVLPRPVADVGRLVEMKVAPRFYRRATIVTLSESSAESIRALGFAAESVRVVPPGVDDRFRPDHRRRTPHPSLVIVGRQAPVKRIDRALEAAASVRRVIPDLSVEVIGDGPERAALREWVDGHGAAHWVSLRGRVGDVELAEAYQRAWAVVSASYAEGWGMSLTEGAACGTPAVATDIAGHRGAVRPGVTGLLVAEPTESGSLAESLAGAVLELFGDRSRWEQMATAAAEHGRSLSWDSVAAQHLALLAESVGDGGLRRARRD